METRNQRAIAALMTLSLIAGCGGSGESGNPSSGFQGNSAQQTNSGFALNGRILAPQPGFRLSTLQVLNSIGPSSISNSGDFTTTDFSQKGGQLMFVVDANDNIIYAAFQEQGQEVGPRTTAQVLLYFSARVFALPPNLQLAVRQQLLKVPELDALAAAISQALAQDPANGLTSPAVQTAIQAALASMRARGLTSNRLLVNPGVEQSGITPNIQGSNQLTLTNVLRRPAWAFVTKISTKADDGPETPVDPPVAVTDFEIPAIVGANSFASAAGDAAVVLYSQLFQNIRSGPVAGEPVTTSPLALPTQDRVTTTYKVEVVGPGLSGSLPTDPIQRAKLKELTLKFAGQQFLAFLTNVLFNVGADKIDGLNSQTSDFSLVLTDFVNLLTSLVPAIAEKAERGDLNGVLESMFSFALSDSASSRAALVNLTFFLGERVAPLIGASTPNNAKFFGVMRRFALITNVVDGVLTTADTAFAGGSLASANLYEQFSVKSLSDKVRLTPLSPTMQKDQEQQFTATVPSVTLEPNQFLEFHWVCSGTAGTLLSPTGADVNDFTTSQTTGPVYSSEQEGTDTIQVSVTLVDAGNNTRTELGSASTTVKVEAQSDNLLVNGDFSAGPSSWTQQTVRTALSSYPHFAFPNTSTQLPSQNGNTFFSLDVPAGSSGYISQSVTLPNDATAIRLVYRTWGALDAVNGFASADSLVDNFRPVQLEISGGGSETRTLDITSLKGRTVEIRLGGTSSGFNGTFVLFDDVGVFVTR